MGRRGHGGIPRHARSIKTVAFDYDAAGRLASEPITVTFGRTTTYTVQSAYDAANRRMGITYPDSLHAAARWPGRPAAEVAANLADHALPAAVHAVN